MDYIWLILSILLLATSSDYLVVFSQKMAKFFRIPPHVFGTIIVGPATSLPEIVVSIEALSKHYPDMVIGNALGSTIANISLILAISLFFIPKQFIHRQSILWQFFDILMLSLCLLLGYTHWVLSLLLLLVYLLRICYSHHSSIDIETNTTDSKIWKIVIYFAASLLILLVASELFVDACQSIAVKWGVSDLVIGLSIVALGTSLPELATNLSSIRHKDYELAIGNVLGSNTICLLGIASLGGWWDYYPIPTTSLARDIPIIIGLICIVLTHTYFKNKWVMPSLLLTTYIVYQVSLFS